MKSLLFYFLSDAETWNQGRLLTRDLNVAKSRELPFPASSEKRRVDFGAALRSGRGARWGSDYWPHQSCSGDESVNLSCPRQNLLCCMKGTSLLKPAGWSRDCVGQGQAGTSGDGMGTHVETLEISSHGLSVWQFLWYFGHLKNMFFWILWGRFDLGFLLLRGCACPGAVFSCVVSRRRQGGPWFLQEWQGGTTWLGPAQPGCAPRTPHCHRGLAGEARNPSSAVAADTEKSCSLPVWFDQFPLKLCLQSGLCPRFSCAAARGFAGFLNYASEDITVAKLRQTEFVV